jgi:hypothetical protein
VSTLERFVSNVSGGAKERKLDGRDHLVVPTVMILEGVWLGDSGPGYYSEIEIRRSIPTYGHKPAVVSHPRLNGKGITACDPEVIDNQRVGIILNSSWKGKLRSDTWLDMLKTDRVDERIIPAVRTGKKMEVSTGVLVEPEKVPGTWKGRPYDWVARNQVGDHLAILPDSVGACSIADGAGLLQLNEAAVRGNDAVREVLQRSIEGGLRDLGLAENEMSFSDITSQLCEKLMSSYGEPGKSWMGYVCEVFPDYVIYRDGNGDLYKVGYKTDGDSLSLVGDPVEVNRVVSYQPAPTENEAVANHPEGEQMSKSFDRKAHLNSLRGTYSEQDLLTLEKLSDEQLQIFKPVQNTKTPEVVAPEGYEAVEKDGKVTFNKKATPTPAPTPQPTPPPSTTPQQQQVANDDYLNNLPPHVRAVVKVGLKSFAAERDGLIQTIVANEKNKFSKEQLEAMGNQEDGIETLRAIASLIPQQQQQTQNTLWPVSNWRGAQGAPPPVGVPEQSIFLDVPSPDEIWKKN